VLAVMTLDKVEHLLLTFSERFAHSVQVNTFSPKGNAKIGKRVAGLVGL
jgi:hypothetical protein